MPDLPPDLPLDWEPVVTEFGVPYYWNRKTNESVYMCMCVVCLVRVYALFPARACANVNARISFECADLI